jgi:hypothetical protein
MPLPALNVLVNALLTEHVTARQNNFLLVLITHGAAHALIILVGFKLKILNVG